MMMCKCHYAVSKTDGMKFQPIYMYSLITETHKYKPTWLGQILNMRTVCKDATYCTLYSLQQRLHFACSHNETMTSFKPFPVW